MTAVLLPLNSARRFWIFDFGERSGYIFAEEVDVTGQLFERDLGIDFWAVAQVLPRGWTSAAGIWRSRAMSERMRSSGGANLRSIKEKALPEMPVE